MRPHGRAHISAKSPVATAVCDRCGFLYSRTDLRWQFDYLQGPRLFNLRILVCPPCEDLPQENGRTIVLPPDPVPILNPRPENYVDADNPLSTLLYNVADAFFPKPLQSLGGNIGNMTLNAGVDAAFDGVVNKKAQMCAALAASNSSFQNTVGKNWAADPSGMTLILPSTVPAPTHIVSTFTITAPNDRRFLNSVTGVTGFHLDGSSNGTSWTTIYSSSTAGTVGESITATSTSLTPYQYHRIAIQGDGISAVAIAQATFNVSDGAPNDI
jgi:hypothetical protein